MATNKPTASKKSPTLAPSAKEGVKEKGRTIAPSKPFTTDDKGQKHPEGMEERKEKGRTIPPSKPPTMDDKGQRHTEGVEVPVTPTEPHKQRLSGESLRSRMVWRQNNRKGLRYRD